MRVHVYVNVSPPSPSSMNARFSFGSVESSPSRITLSKHLGTDARFFVAGYGSMGSYTVTGAGGAAVDSPGSTNPATRGGGSGGSSGGGGRQRRRRRRRRRVSPAQFEVQQVIRAIRNRRVRHRREVTVHVQRHDTFAGLSDAAAGALHLEDVLSRAVGYHAESRRVPDGPESDKRTSPAGE